MNTASLSLDIAVESSDERPFEQRVSYWERALVGQLARQVHAAGYQFIGWPTSRQSFAGDGLVKLVVTVGTEPRK